MHLCDDVMVHGSLQSAYKFENNSGKIARTIKHGKNVAQQIHNRALERLSFISFAKNEQAEFKKDFFCPIQNNKCFKRFIVNGISIDSCKRNQWFLTKNRELCSFICLFIEDGIKISCKKYQQQQLQSFYTSPKNSVELDIFFG